MDSPRFPTWFGGLAALFFVGYSWPATPLEETREQRPAPSLGLECGLRSHRVFRGNLVRLDSGPGFSGFDRELDGLTYGAYYGTQDALQAAKILPPLLSSAWQIDEYEGRYGFNVAWKMAEPSRQKIILLERGTHCDLVVLIDLKDQGDWAQELPNLLEAIAPAQRHKSSK